MPELTPQRPYLLRAMYDWLVDNGLTPHLAVSADLPGVVVPRQYVKDGQIVLNVAPHSVGNLQLGIDEVRFNARFGGQPQAIVLPLYAIDAIYARENGAGTLFPPEEAYEQALEGDESSLPEPSPTEAEPKPEQPPKGRPSLRVIK